MNVCKCVFVWFGVDPDGSARVLRVLLAAVNGGAVCHRTVSTLAGRFNIIS